MTDIEIGMLVAIGTLIGVVIGSVVTLATVFFAIWKERGGL